MVKQGKLEKECSIELKKWRWRILLGFGLLYFLYYFGRENIGFIIPLLKEERGWTSAQLGMVSSGFFWAYALGHLLWGRLGDRLGGRLLCTVGGLLSTVFNWICSLAGSVTTLVIPWTANGLAQSMGWAPGNRLIANWWPSKERGYAVGIALSLAGAAVTAVWLFSGWVGTRWGWKGLFRIPVVLLGVMSIAYFFLIRDHPRQVGLFDYGEENSQTTNHPNIYRDKGIGPYLNILGNYEFALACLSAGTANFARLFFTIWIPLYYSQMTGFPLQKIAFICLTLPVGMSLGPAIVGWISDRFFKARRYPVIVVFLFISALSTITLSYVSAAKFAGNAVLLFWIGFSVLGVQGPIHALCADLAGKNRTGTAIGIMSSASYIIGGLQGIVIGGILTLSGANWRLVFFLVAAVQLAGAGVAWSIKR